jgi:hypothetical protein
MSCLTIDLIETGKSRDGSGQRAFWMRSSRNLVVLLPAGYDGIGHGSWGGGAFCILCLNFSEYLSIRLVGLIGIVSRKQQFFSVEVVMAKPVGKLRKINLSEVWGNEADGFASWLQQEEILDILGETIERPLKPAGSDIPLSILAGGVLAKDAKTGSYVIVLGHLEGIDPDALGKLIMYAAGLDAKTVVCVAQSISAEIRQTLDWLNGVSRDEVTFYGAELELWRIDDSVPAPNFHLVCQPNLWARQLKKGQDEGGESKAAKESEFAESNANHEEGAKGPKEKGAAPQGKPAAVGKDGVSVRQNFVYTKTFS